MSTCTTIFLGVVIIFGWMSWFLGCAVIDISKMLFFYLSCCVIIPMAASFTAIWVNLLVRRGRSAVSSRGRCEFLRVDLPLLEPHSFGCCKVFLSCGIVTRGMLLLDRNCILCRASIEGIKWKLTAHYRRPVWSHLPLHIRRMHVITRPPGKIDLQDVLLQRYRSGWLHASLESRLLIFSNVMWVNTVFFIESFKLSQKHLFNLRSHQLGELFDIFWALIDILELAKVNN